MATRSVFFKAVGPIGDTDSERPAGERDWPCGRILHAVPRFFTGFKRSDDSAVLKRDDVQIGLAVNGLDPEQASCWFSVGDVDALWP